ncbi:microfibril-associated glycoprotein 4-like [Engraulis encrasicolus]|uniref:microfibril-associated glycoprotein 4-like n=1 Tax=Engraulis encrasicolus TaxID=184585 RepID=UPI002FCF4FFB
MGAWITVILKRVDGTVSFYRPWDAYKEGFGNKDGEYWLGLETMYRLTWPSKYELRVDMEDWQGGSVFAQYTSFSVESEDDGYRLRLGNYVDGGARDSLTYVNGYRFSTYDKDQDGWSSNCAHAHKGGFWFYSCHYANPNGLFQKGQNYGEGINWYHWKTNYYSLKSMTMKIRRVTPPE